MPKEVVNKVRSYGRPLEDWLEDYNVKSSRQSTILSQLNSQAVFGQIADTPLAILLGETENRALYNYAILHDIKDDALQLKTNEVMLTNLMAVFAEDAQALIRRTFAELELKNDGMPLNSFKLQENLDEKENAVRELLNIGRKCLEGELNEERLHTRFKQFLQIVELSLEPYLRGVEKSGIEHLPDQIKKRIKKLDQPEEKGFAPDVLFRKYCKSLSDLSNLSGFDDSLLDARENLIQEAIENLKTVIDKSILSGSLLEEKVKNYYDQIERFDSILREAYPLVMQLKATRVKSKNLTDDQLIPDNFKARAEKHYYEFLQKPFSKEKNLVADLNGVLAILEMQLQQNQDAQQAITGSNRCFRLFKGKALSKLIQRGNQLTDVSNQLMTAVGKYTEFSGQPATSKTELLSGMRALLAKRAQLEKGHSMRFLGGASGPPELKRTNTGSRKPNPGTVVRVQPRPRRLPSEGEALKERAEVKGKAHQRKKTH